MLSSWYERKLLKKLNKNIKWSDSLKHRTKFLSAVLSIGIIPLKIRLMLTDNIRIGWLSMKYARLIRKLLDKLKRANSDYVHCTSLNNFIADKLVDDVQNNSRNEANNND